MNSLETLIGCCQVHTDVLTPSASPSPLVDIPMWFEVLSGEWDAFSTECVTPVPFYFGQPPLERLALAARFHALRVNASTLVANRHPKRDKVCELY